MLSKLSVPGRPTNLDNSRARAYCSCSRCGWGWFEYFFSHLSFLSSFSPLWETARYRLKYCLKGPLKGNRLIKSTIEFLLKFHTVMECYMLSEKVK